MTIPPISTTDRTPVIVGNEQTQTPPREDITSRVRSIAEPAFYALYTFFNPMPPCEEFDPPSLFEYTDLPMSYEETVLNWKRWREETINMVGSEDVLFPQGSRVRELYLDNPAYADPAFRMQEARKYWEDCLIPTNRNAESFEKRGKRYWTLALCDVEIRDLFHREYRKKQADDVLPEMKQIFRMAGGVLPEDVAAQHRATWDQMSKVERAKKICYGGDPSRYAIAALAISAFAGSYYFLA